ncbi:hypothetical protein JOM56_013389 [Amanita muscaria]
MYYERHFPPLTNRLIFDAERCPSLPALITITNRTVFEVERSFKVAASQLQIDEVRKISVEQPSWSKGHPLGSPGSPYVAGLSKISGNLKQRPKGPLSKPKAGGYSLKETLGWSNDAYRNVQTTLQRLCAKHFDTRYLFSSQRLDALQRYRDEAALSFPILQEYEELWPVDDFATMYLKNTSAEFRKKNKQ